MHFWGYTLHTGNPSHLKSVLTGTFSPVAKYMHELYHISTCIYKCLIYRGAYNMQSEANPTD